MSQDLVFFYQLQNLDYTTIANRNFRFAVVDDDDSKLTTRNLQDLNAQGKAIWAYISAGEAETYRDY